MEGFTIISKDGMIHTECSSINKKGHLDVLMLGYLNPPNLNPKIIPDIKINQNLDGVYSIAIINNKRKTAKIFQDQYGGNIPIYYSKVDKAIIISTSLKKIISKTKDIKLNKRGLQDFLHNRFLIPNKQTLVKRVYKLTRGNELILDWNNNNITQNKIKRSTEEPRNLNIIKSIKDNCKYLIERKKNIALSLSSGYDTNLLLNILQKNNLTAFTIKGKKIDESKSAKKISKIYKIEHITKEPKENIITMLNNIVNITEGYCFERGMFLQYTLSQELNKNGIKTLIAGDGADQILDQYRFSLFHKIKYEFFLFKEILKGKKISERFRPSLIISFLKNPFMKNEFDSELDLILKKNGIMANSNNIKTIYPFLNKETLNISKALGERSERKSLYTKEVLKILPEKIKKHISSQGGTTDLGFLVKGNEKKLKNIIQESNLFDKYNINKIIKDKNHDLLLRLAYLSIFKNKIIENKK